MNLRDSIGQRTDFRNAERERTGAVRGLLGPYVSARRVRPNYKMVVKEVPIDGDTEVTFTLSTTTDEQASQTNSTANESAAA